MLYIYIYYKQPPGREQPGWGTGVPAPAAAWGIWPGSSAPTPHLPFCCRENTIGALMITNAILGVP